ncbi:hypothetical protein HS088_TW06G00181 [Tripterygium wilfordii]|uniref:Uncharacterized protein n=1 Tax=Tripterygium wilfordii TaxID=458696 RepID=A0A7J7DIY2_TRIWF|nr:uncharacterized protein At5g23160-like [Tripterygium wilfordii]KAF5746016.1 hypothetical protein HS088_TW06G00181 [Tripterygium wilfordii]
MMKDVSKNKFLPCFRPVVVDHVDLVLESKGAVEKDSMIKSSTLEGKKSENPMTVRPPKRKLSRAIKAVVFEMILAKRARDRRVSRENLRQSKQVSSSTNITVSDNDDASKNRVFDSPREIKSNSGSSSSWSFDSSSSLSISKSELKIDVSKDRKSSYSITLNSGIYLLLLSLTLTILWGKLCAILFTTIWLYLLPRRRTRDGFRPETVITPSTETESTEYKKKVIMEGLLERNHHNRGR